MFLRVFTFFKVFTFLWFSGDKIGGVKKIGPAGQKEKILVRGGSILLEGLKASGGIRRRSDRATATPPFCGSAQSTTQGGGGTKPGNPSRGFRWIPGFWGRLSGLLVDSGKSSGLRSIRANLGKFARIPRGFLAR